MSKLSLFEIFTVENGDRDDHVAVKGRVKRRLDIINALQDKPFVFLINFQIPGDPPVSLVAYFLIPSDLLLRRPGPTTEKFKKYNTIICCLYYICILFCLCISFQIV
jgi:hypothetical protein